MARGDPLPGGGDALPVSVAVLSVGDDFDAIVAGTATAADVCGLADQIGTLEPRKRADLVVAAGNPLDDVRLLADAGNITLVVQDGRIVKHTTQTVEQITPKRQGPRRGPGPRRESRSSRHRLPSWCCRPDPARRASLR
jgi:cytosine/adenosine deaminase-related metal-dependent hydrolase